MRILYGINGTGNGHRSRALELVPALSRRSDLDVIVSGTAYSLPMPFPLKAEYAGFSFAYRRGRVDLRQSIQQSRLSSVIRDVRGLDVSCYDLVVSDFEPVSAWAARTGGRPVIGVSHQASFRYPAVPRPSRKDHLSEWFMRTLAPTPSAIGLHYARYAPGVLPPIIRERVRELSRSFGNHIVVYLPAIELDELVPVLAGQAAPFVVFSPAVDAVAYRAANVRVEPSSDANFADQLASSSGVLCHAGFELPSEAMYLGKPLLACPIGRQYEQQCNAAALERLGVEVIWDWDASVKTRIAEWIRLRRPVHLPEVTHVGALADAILSYASPGATRRRSPNRPVAPMLKPQSMAPSPEQVA